MNFDFKVGEFYKTRDGRKVEIIRTGLLRHTGAAEPQPMVAGIVTEETGTQSVTEYLLNGNAPMWHDRWKIEEPWTEPEFFYKPIFKIETDHGDNTNWWKDKDEVYEYIGKYATAENPLLGVLRWNKTWNELKLMKETENGSF